MRAREVPPGWLRGACAALAAALLGLPAPAPARAGGGRVLFETDVRPVLEARCVKCHGGKGKGGLDLRRRASLLRGGDSGPAVLPGKPDDSLLLRRVERGEMPPPKE